MGYTQNDDLDELLNLVSSLVCTLTDDCISTINPEGVNMIAAPSRDAVIGLPFTALIAEDYRFLLEVGWGLLAEEDIVPLKLQRFNGEVFDAELRVRPLGQGTNRMFVEVRDISKYVRSAHTLREREERLQNILHSVAEGIVTVTEDGKIETANNAAERMFHCPPRGLIGRFIETLITEPTNLSEKLSFPSMPTTSGAVFEGLGVRMDGGYFALEFVCNELRHGRQKLFTAILRDISERKENEDRIRRLAHHDTLTGLPNRNLLHDRMAQALARVRRHGGRLAILFIDLDRFKPINDKYGHNVGDAVLVEAARRLQDSVRHSDTVARIGGDEFAIVLEEMVRPTEAAKVAGKIVSYLASPIEVLGHTCMIGASVGVALYPDDGSDLDEVIKAADLAMYRVKSSGRNGFRMYSDMDDYFDEVADA